MGKMRIRVQYSKTLSVTHTQKDINLMKMVAEFYTC